MRSRLNLCRLLAAAAWLGGALAVAAAEFMAGQFDYKSQHEKADDAVERLRGYRLVDDDDAASGQALQVALNRQLTAKDSLWILSVPAVDTAAVGLYRATVRMKVQGMLNTLGSGVRIRAAGLNERTVYMNEFAEEDVYQEFTLDFEVREADIVARTPAVFLEMARARLNLKDERAVAALKAALEAAPNRELVFAKAREPEFPFTEQQITTLNSLGKGPATVAVSLEFPHWTRAARGPSTPFPTLRRLTVERVRVEKLPEAESFTLREVDVAYAWRRPGETQRFRVWLHNRSGTDRTASLRLTVRYGLDGSRVLGERPIRVKDGGYLTVEWPWEVPADHPRYGQEIEAAVLENGTVTDTVRSWFTVHPRVTAVLIPYNDSLHGLRDVRYRHPYTPLPNVGNYFEQWAPTPYDSAGLVPEDIDKPFSRGNSGGFLTIAGLRETVRRFHERGVASAFYLEGHGTGCKSWDLLFDKPEQVVYANIQTEEFYHKRRQVIDTDYPAFLRGEWSDPKSPGSEPGYPHTGFVMYNGLFKEPVDRVIQGTLELSRLVGYDGIRWDSCLPFQAWNHDILGRDYGKTPADLRQVQLENFARFRREVRAMNPNFEWRMNGGIGALMAKPEDPFDFARARALIEDDFHKVFLADDGGIQEEAWGHSYLNFPDYKNVCLNYLRAVRYESAAYKYAGGHHAHMHSYNLGMFYTPDDFYKQAFTLLGGAHMDSMNYGPFPDSDLDLGVYAARFGEFFWDPALTQLERIDEKVTLDIDEDLWYTEAGFEKATARGTWLYVLPIINPPVTERWQKNRFGQLPAPVRGPIGVTVKLPPGYAKVRGVHLLENSPWPASRPLPFKVENGAVSYEIAGLHIFKVAVVEFAK